MSPLSDMAENEKLLGDLYRIYKRRFLNNSYLWSRLVQDECNHADVLNQLCTDNKTLEAISKKINIKPIAVTRILISSELEQAINVSLKAALNRAIKLEQAILSAKYLSALERVKSLPSEDLLEIEFDINQHLNMLSGALLDIGEKSPIKAS